LRRLRMRRRRCRGRACPSPTRCIARARASSCLRRVSDKVRADAGRRAAPCVVRARCFHSH
jgi:hypothetical protein